MMNHRSKRRAFLRGAGLGAFALPFVRLASGHAAPANARRLVVFATPNGTVMEEFFPDANGYRRILKPLEPMKAKLLVMRGIDRMSALKAPVPANHDPDNPNMLTARQSRGGGPGQMGGISIDQHIANAIGAQTKFASLQLGVNVGSYCGVIVARGVGQGVFPENSPYRAYQRMFKDVVADPAELDRLRRDRKSMMDLLRAEVGDLRCALGAEERPKLDQHLESLRELEKSLDVTVVGCGPPHQGAPVAENTSNFPQLVKLQMDVAAAALACDLTRVITFQVGAGSSIVQFRWLGINYNHHGISHGSEGVTAPMAQRTEWLNQIELWHAQQYAYLVGKLDAINDGGGTLLDNSAVVWMHEQANGGTHGRKDHPYVIAGSLRGTFRLGRAVNFGGKTHNGLLIALASGVGVPTPQFGDPDYSSGPLADL